jgi:hypothetical protein
MWVDYVETERIGICLTFFEEAALHGICQLSIILPFLRNISTMTDFSPEDGGRRFLRNIGNH